MKIESLGEVIELKKHRDRLDSIVWRCRNTGDGQILVLLPPLNVSLPDGTVVTMPEEAMELLPGSEEQAILKHTEEQALKDIAKVDELLAELGVEISPGEIGLKAIAAPAVPDGTQVEAAPAA